MLFLDCCPAHKERFVQQDSITLNIFFFGLVAALYSRKINIQKLEWLFLPRSCDVYSRLERGKKVQGCIFVSQYFKSSLFFSAISSSFSVCHSVNWNNKRNLAFVFFLSLSFYFSSSQCISWQPHQDIFCSFTLSIFLKPTKDLIFSQCAIFPPTIFVSSVRSTLGLTLVPK